MAAVNCLIPATNQGGIVSTAIRMPKKVVPQTTATVNIARNNLGSLNMNEVDFIRKKGERNGCFLQVAKVDFKKGLTKPGK